jgi:adenine-specific DNA-methyltransferase
MRKTIIASAEDLPRQRNIRPSKQGCLKHIKKLSYGESGTGNKIIQGNNISVLREIGGEYESKVRCIYIDPPYNNQEKYTHYNDDDHFEEWIKNLIVCVSHLKALLRQDGSIWVSIDDSQIHYLKVYLDEIFGRENFITTIIWQQRTSRENRNVFSNDHEYILVYAKNYIHFKKSRNLLTLSQEIKDRYKNPDRDPRGAWQSVSANVQAGHGVASQFYDIVAPNGRRHRPPKGRCWVYNEARMKQEIKENNIWFGKSGNGAPRLKRFLTQAKPGMTPKTLWTASEVGTNDLAKKQMLQLLPNLQLFDTPKPEPLIHRILEIATNPGDLVLDAYLGSGTTAAVAHKMERKYIGIEVGDHVVSHCIQRLKKVVGGACSGLSDRVEWNGGGGFDFFRHE